MKFKTFIEKKAQTNETKLVEFLRSEKLFQLFGMIYNKGYKKGGA